MNGNKNKVKDRVRKKLNLPEWTNQEHGEIAKPESDETRRFRMKDLPVNGLSVKTKVKNNPLGDLIDNPPVKRKNSVLSGNAADMLSEKQKKVSKPYQKRVNKVLGY